MGTSRDDYLTVIKEQLDSKTQLTSLLFQPGGNVYVFTYLKNGQKKHILIDTGDYRYYDEILSVLGENDVDATNIEKIIITHRHTDHTGLLYLLAKQSGAKIVAHHTFNSFVESSTSYDSTESKEYDFDYLTESGTSNKIRLAGIDFPHLAELTGIGETGHLSILGSPKTATTHSPDQLIVLYSQRSDTHPHFQTVDSFRPTNDILFSGDLWLMRGPMFGYGSADIMWHVKAGLRQVRNMMTGVTMMGRDPRDQDAEAKDALKRGFCLIRVKPGHGNEFLGSRIIPNSLLADNDLLIEFGYKLGAGKKILESMELAPRVAARREQSYISFIEELTLWVKLGYTYEEISKLLVQIFREQSGGGPLVEEDRRERRERLKELLSRLRSDEVQPAEIRQLAESTLPLLR